MRKPQAPCGQLPISWTWLAGGSPRPPAARTLGSDPRVDGLPDPNGSKIDRPRKAPEAPIRLTISRICSVGSQSSLHPNSLSSPGVGSGGVDSQPVRRQVTVTTKRLRADAAFSLRVVRFGSWAGWGPPTGWTVTPPLPFLTSWAGWGRAPGFAPSGTGRRLFWGPHLVTVTVRPLLLRVLPGQSGLDAQRRLTS